MSDAAPPPPIAAPEPKASVVDGGVQKAALIGVLTSAAVLASTIVRTKVTAIVLGVDGLGMSATVVAVVEQFQAPLGLITGAALIGAFGRALKKGDSGQEYYDTAATLVIVVGATITALSFVTALAIRRDPWLATLSGLAAVALIFNNLLAVASAALLARKDTRRYGMIAAGSNVLLALSVAAATAVGGLTGQFVAVALVPLVLLAIFGGTWRAGLPGLRLVPRLAVHRGFIAEVAPVGGATLIADFTGKSALNTVRAVVALYGRNHRPVLDSAGNNLNLHGDWSLGQFQSAWTVGGRYVETILGGVSYGVAPRFASATREELPKEVEAASKFVFDAAPPIILMAIALREPLMHLLYSGKFDLASEIVGYQMAGDLAKSLSYVYAMVLLYRGEVRAFLVTEVSAALLLAGIPLLLVPIVGEVGATYGYAITYCVYALITALVLRRACGVPLHPGRLVAVLVFTATAAITVRLCLEHPWLRAPLLVVGVIWGLRTNLAATVWGGVRRRLTALFGRGQASS